LFDEDTEKHIVDTFGHVARKCDLMSSRLKER